VLMVVCISYRILYSLESRCQACFVSQSSFVNSTTLCLENGCFALQLFTTRVKNCANHIPYLQKKTPSTLLNGQ